MSIAEHGPALVEAFVPDPLTNETVTPLAGLAEFMAAEKGRLDRGDTGTNAYLALQEIMWLYVGDPDQSKRQGLHDVPGATIETSHGERIFSMGCAAQFDPESGELCIVRRDPEFDNNDPSSWLIVRAQIRTGAVSTEQVIGVSSKKDPATDETAYMLTLVPHKMNETSQLKLTLDPQSQSKGQMRLEHPKYYGRGVGEHPEVLVEESYSMDIGMLLQEVETRSAARMLDAFAIGTAATAELISVS